MSGFRLFDLNPEQEQAVRTTEGPLLILAGAGTGKTRVITARVAYIISRGTPPEKVLAVTFTNKAATEMRERLETLIPKEQAKKVTMSTFHALCVRILRQDIEKLGFKRNFSIYDEGDQMGLIKKIITRVAARDEKLDPNVAKSLISKAKNNGWREPEDDRTLVGAVFARYQAELKTLNAVDFDDLLLLTVKLLAEHAGRSATRCGSQRGRGGRRRSINLRVARRGGREHPRIRGAFSKPHGGEAGAELSLDQCDPRHGEWSYQKQSAAPPQAALERAGRRRQGASHRDGG
jgi:ATP-dependent exoDNAse (exonuclease V) beta subunit